MDDFVKRPTKIGDIDINKKVVLDIDAFGGAMQVFDSPFIGLFEKLDSDYMAQMQGGRIEHLLREFAQKTSTSMDEVKRLFQQVQSSAGNKEEAHDPNASYYYYNKPDDRWKQLYEKLKEFLDRELRRPEQQPYYYYQGDNNNAPAPGGPGGPGGGGSVATETPSTTTSTTTSSKLPSTTSSNPILPSTTSTTTSSDPFADAMLFNKPIRFTKMLDKSKAEDEAFKQEEVKKKMQARIDAQVAMKARQDARDQTARDMGLDTTFDKAKPALVRQAFTDKENGSRTVAQDNDIAWYSQIIDALGLAGGAAVAAKGAEAVVNFNERGGLLLSLITQLRGYALAQAQGMRLGRY